MVRLFGYACALLLLSLSLALVTRSLVLRLLAVITGLGIIGLYVYLLLRQPVRHGTLSLPELQEPAEVRWDEHGQPHVTARTLHDLYFAQGYVTAQDRLWHMEVCRRTAAGRLAEAFGEQMLSRDRCFRSLGLYAVAQESWPLYSDEGRAVLEAYAAGVNACISEGKLPVEFVAAGLKPEPWRAVDSLAVAKLVAYELSPSWGDSLFQMELVRMVGPEKAAALWGDATEVAVAELTDLSGLAALATRKPLTVCGASAWAISGQRSQSSLPILGSSLETAPRVPAPVYPVRLTCLGEFDQSGATLPGIPGLFTGETDRFAWGFSPVEAETQRLALVEPTVLAAAERRVEQIRVRGKQAPVAHEVVTTAYGPVLVCDDHGGVALQSPILQPSTEVEALLSLNRSRSLADFTAALSTWGTPVLTAVYAGVDGQIARVETGPAVAGVAGDPARPEESAASILVAAPTYGAERLKEYLAARAHWNREQLEPLLSDTVSLQARRFIQPLMGCVQEGLRQGHQPETLSTTEKQALLLLSDWDGDESAASGAACLWEQWYHFLAEAIFRPQMGLDLFNRFMGTRRAASAIDGLVQAVLEGQESPWLRLEGELGLPRLALRSFRRAVALLAAKQGRRLDHWRYGKEHRVRFTHSLGLTSPVLAHLLNLGPYPLAGSAATLDRSHADPLEPLGAISATTHRRLVDLGLPDEAVAGTVPGISGHPLSGNYTGQMGHWLRREAMPRVRRYPDRGSRLTLTPTRT